MLNSIHIMGRLTADPELKSTSSGTAVCSFTLAVERDGKPDESGKRHTDFIDLVAWRGTAEFISRYFRKGRMAVVEGRLQTRAWKDRNDQSRKTTEVIVDNIYFGDSKREENSREETGREELRFKEEPFGDLIEYEELPF